MSPPLATSLATIQFVTQTDRQTEDRQTDDSIMSTADHTVHTTIHSPLSALMLLAGR